MESEVKVEIPDNCDDRNQSSDNLTMLLTSSLDDVSVRKDEKDIITDENIKKFTETDNLQELTLVGVNPTSVQSFNMQHRICLGEADELIEEADIKDVKELPYDEIAPLESTSQRKPLDSPDQTTSDCVAQKLLDSFEMNVRNSTLEVQNIDGTELSLSTDMPESVKMGSICDMAACVDCESIGSDDSQKANPRQDLSKTVVVKNNTSNENNINQCLVTDDSCFSRSDFFKLPPELLLKIFSYLSLEDVCLRIAPLCRYCYILSRDSALWRNLYIYRSCSIESVLMLLSHATQAEVLHIANHPHIESILVNSLTVPSCAKTLNCLDIGFSDISPAVLKTTFSTDLPRLVHLNLEGCRFLDMDSLLVIIPRVSKSLKRISLSHCFRLTDDCLTYICEALPYLTHVNLDGVEWISDQGVKTIVDHLGAIILALWLDGENLSNTSCELVAQCQRLRLLSIRYCECFTNVLPLRQISTLRSLSIRKNSEIDRDQVTQLFDFNDSHLTGLNYLDISECYAINDDIVGVICRLCGSSLSYLMLEWCWEVTDAGIQKIAESCPHLIRLCLNGMHNLIGHPFASIPSVFPCLSVLNLTNCNSICDELIQKVVDENPHLIVFTYYGERFETQGAVLPELTTEHDLWRIPVSGQSRICDC